MGLILYIKPKPTYLKGIFFFCLPTRTPNVAVVGLQNAMPSLFWHCVGTLDCFRGGTRGGILFLCAFPDFKLRASIKRKSEFYGTKDIGGGMLRGKWISLKVAIVQLTEKLNFSFQERI